MTHSNEALGTSGAASRDGVDIRAVEYALRDASRPLVVLGPSLGTSATTLWGDVAARLTAFCDVIAWDLPGHGVSPALDPTTTLSDLSQLATAVDALAHNAQRSRGDEGAPFWYAGASVGGAVGLQLMLDSPARVSGAALICTSARIGSADMWHTRADLVASAGTSTQIERASSLWFTPRLLDTRPDVASQLLGALHTTDAHSYASVCRALAEFDVRERLAEITVPVVALAGAHDQATPVADMAQMAAALPRSSFAVADTAHQAPAEDPATTASAILDLVHAQSSPGAWPASRRHIGMERRREVLGDAHVARAVGATTPLTSAFQNFITEYAWGEVWSRPGLDSRSRSIVTVTALIAGHHWDELPMHLRAARRNGLTDEEIGEVLLQSAIYCSVPTANRAFAIARDVLAEDAEHDGNDA